MDNGALLQQNVMTSPSQPWSTDWSVGGEGGLFRRPDELCSDLATLFEVPARAVVTRGRDDIGLTDDPAQPTVPQVITALTCGRWRRPVEWTPDREEPTLALKTVNKKSDRDFRSKDCWSANWKLDVVVRLLRSEKLEEVSWEVGVETHRLAAWRPLGVGRWMHRSCDRSRSQPDSPSTPLVASD